MEKCIFIGILTRTVNLSLQNLGEHWSFVVELTGIGRHVNPFNVVRQFDSVMLIDVNVDRTWSHFLCAGHDTSRLFLLCLYDSVFSLEKANNQYKYEELH